MPIESNNFTEADIGQRTESEEINRFKMMGSEERSQALAAFESKITPAIRNTLKKHSRPQIAEDIWQTTLVKAERAFNNFRGESTIKTWLTRIAVNESLMFLRSNKRELYAAQLDGQHDLSDGSPNKEEQMLAEEHRNALLPLVKGLPPLLRDPIMLKYYEELTVEQASKRLNITVPAFKSRLNRAHKELMKKFQTRNLKQEKKKFS